MCALRIDAPPRARRPAKKHLRIWDEVNDLETFEKWFGHDSDGAVQAAVDLVTASGCHSLLEVGPGLCQFYHKLVRAQPLVSYTGVEVSRVFVDHAEKLGVHVLEGDVESLPFAAKSFDCCYARHVLLHQPDFRQGLEEMLRVATNLVIVDFASTSKTNIRFDAKWGIYKNSYACEDIESYLSAHERVREHGWLYGPYKPERARVLAIRCA